MVKLKIKNENGDFNFKCQLCSNDEFEVTLYQGDDMYICEECREWYIPNKESIRQVEVCEACGAEIIDGGSCFYCETKPQK